jgi:hypothetical protein
MRVLLLIAVGASRLAADSYVTPRMLEPCEMLVPGQLVFRGEVVSVEEGLVRYRVLQAYAGVKAGKTVEADGSWKPPLGWRGLVQVVPSGSSTKTIIASPAFDQFVERWAKGEGKETSLRVDVAAYRRPSAEFAITLRGPGRDRRAIVGSGGPVWFEGLKAGSYTIEASAPGYSITPLPVELVRGSCYQRMLVARGINSVSGQITTALGRPAPGTTVRFEQSSPQLPPLIKEAVTDEDGRYAVTGLLDGSYRVRFVATSGMVTEHPMAGVSVRADQPTTFNGRLRRDFLFLRVERANGSLVLEEEVCTRDERGRVQCEVPSAEGFVILPLVPGVRHAVTVWTTKGEAGEAEFDPSWLSARVQLAPPSRK